MCDECRKIRLEVFTTIDAVLNPGRIGGGACEVLKDEHSTVGDSIIRETRVHFQTQAQLRDLNIEQFLLNASKTRGGGNIAIFLRQVSASVDDSGNVLEHCSQGSRIGQVKRCRA